jgi:4-diphosphocytidyl-2-C-methyl-D-erythritol kinase
LPAAERTVRLLCRAKLNLILEIVGRRPDGYHDLATIVHPISLADELTIEPFGTVPSRSGGTRTVPCSPSEPPASRGPDLVTTGLPSPPGEGNIVMRAARAFRNMAGVQPAVRLRLHKRIPSEAGLGGGSADAAAALRGLATLHGWSDDGALLDLARSLGADVPFLLGTGAALAEGTGDRLTALPAADFVCVLAFGRPGVSTAWAYSLVRPEHLSDGARAGEAAALLREGRVADPWNAFESALADTRPDLACLIARMRDLVGGRAGLTGSGACVFGLAPTDAEAQRAAATLAEEGYWTW